MPHVLALSTKNFPKLCEHLEDCVNRRDALDQMLIFLTRTRGAALTIR